MITLDELFQLLSDTKGLTINNDLTLYEGSGYAISLPNKDTQIIEADCDLTVFAHYLAIYAEHTNEDQKIAAWIAEGIIYFSIIEVFASASEAITKGVKRNQLAVYDFEAAQAIYIN